MSRGNPCDLARASVLRGPRSELVIVVHSNGVSYMMVYQSLETRARDALCCKSPVLSMATLNISMRSSSGREWMIVDISALTRWDESPCDGLNIIRSPNIFIQVLGLSEPLWASSSEGNRQQSRRQQSRPRWRGRQRKPSQTLRQCPPPPIQPTALNQTPARCKF